MIRSYISAIRAMLKNGGYVLNEDKVLLNLLTRACKLNNDHLKTRFPIKQGLLYMIMDQIRNIFDKQPYLSCLYQAIFITGYYGLFRVSKLMKTPSGHQVRAKDLHIGKNKNKLLFVLHTSKAHTKGMKPQLIKITSEKSTKQLNSKVNYERRLRQLKDISGCANHRNFMMNNSLSFQTEHRLQTDIFALCFIKQLN